MKKLIILISIILLITGCGSSTKKESDNESKIEIVDCNKKDELVNAGATLIDVREKDEYDEYHLDKAINISYLVIQDKIESIISDKNKKIVVYCKSGKRSNIAAQKLIELGYKNVYDLGSVNNCEK